MMMDDSNDVLGMSIRGEFPQEKVFINEDHPTQILNQLSTLWRDKKFCDASLEVGPVKVFVHRLLLVSACPYLLTIGGQHEAAMLEVRLPMSVGLEGLNIFLTYLYEGVLNLTLSNLESVERLAKALKVEAVISFCDQFRAMAGKPAYVPSKQYDYSLHMTATSLQLNFTEVPLTLSNTVKKETEESSSPSRKRPRNAQVLQESAKGTPNKSTPAKGTEKGPTATREKETRKAAQRSLNMIRSIQQDEAIESQVCIKQEPSSDTEDDSESQGIEPRTDFVQNAAILSLACLNDADSSKSDLNVTDPGLTSTLQNVGEGTDSSLEMLCLDDDTQPRGSPTPINSRPEASESELDLSAVPIVEGLFSQVINKMDSLHREVIRKLEIQCKRVTLIEKTCPETRAIYDTITTLVQKQPPPETEIPELIDEEFEITETDGDASATTYHIAKDELKAIRADSTSVGNFAKKLVVRLCPELFGPENLRRQYSFYGGGPQKKKPLDEERKKVLKKYVLAFYPEVAHPTAWQVSVVNFVNEALRRPVERIRRVDKSSPYNKK